jgi:raffinose/stachyose/melibiose transport system substrate-binding protein
MTGQRKVVLVLMLILASGLLFAQSAPVTIKWFAFSPEAIDAYNSLIAAYQKVEPNVTIDVEAVQGDYPTQLKLKLNSGDTPDIFVGTMGEIALFAEYSADLTNEPFVKNILPSIIPDVTYQGKILGLPVKQDIEGIIYDKKAFADAGITSLPKTFKELEAACVKLKAKGITPFASGFKEWWVYKHVFNHFMDAATNNSPAKTVADFKAGKAHFKDFPALMRYFDMIDLLIKYGTPRPLEVDFNAEISALGSHKVAMITGQGNWAEAGVVGVDPSIQLGFMGLPTGDDPSQSRIVAGPGHAWRINKDSKNLPAVMKFLNFWYNNPDNATYFTDGIKAFSPLKNAPTPKLQIAVPAIAAINKGDVYTWASNYSSDAFHQRFGELVQDYISKAKTRAQAIDEIEKAWMKLGG